MLAEPPPAGPPPVVGLAAESNHVITPHDLPIVDVVGVVKRYRLGNRSVEALRGIDLRIDSPGLHAIMGRSGSGKSTLLHLLAGLDRPDSGAISVSGARIDALDERGLTRYRRRRIGVIFQQFNLLPTLTAEENVMLPGVLDGIPRRDRLDRARELLARLGLAERAGHRPDALSGGEQQRIAIARALFFEPSLLLADEPTGNLDSASSDLLWALLGEIAAQERLTVLMVTHEPAAAARCERVHVLRDGVVADAFEVEGADAGELAHRAERAVGATR
ncbi:MAG TPA: ABC transporter ATP-binding protein [Phycisphaerales bacterium]|nr:ABC transporter ATP-binding protein [Phycisphaerales bacterium]HMP38229.1 ABC transporter ATP-binding protein [Phycisphaerales bacterium]